MGKLSRRVRRQRLVGLESTLTEVEAEAFLVRQGLTRAAKVRGVSMLGEIGTITAFDPAAHAPIKGKVSAGALVKIVTPGVGLAGKVLVRAEVRRARKGPTA